MENKNIGFTTIDEYIATFPRDVQQKLEELRETIRAAAPEAEEKIAYHMPAFTLNGNLVLFSAWKKHIGFYGTSNEIQEALKNELTIFANEKGSLLFPFDKPLPLELISKIVKLRVVENLKNAETKPEKEFPFFLGAPARRALEAKGITTLEQLSMFREAEILNLHGVGPSSIPKLRLALQTAGLSFRSS